MPALTIEQMQAAVKLIEIDGDDAFNAVRDQYGEQVARLILIAHLRRSFGSMNSYPPHPAIDTQVERFLADKGIR
jgi:hypothetical protein